jgi:hypothetical protein
MLIPMPSPAPSVDPAVAEENKKINTATAVGGAAVGVVGGAAVVAGVAQILSNLRPPQIQSNNQNQQRQQREDRNRDKEPSEEELRARAPSPPSPDDIEKLRRQSRTDSTDFPNAPTVDMGSALFAFRPEDVATIRRVLAENGIVHEIIRAPL